MKTVGITGGIGSGKSVVCEILRILNYPVYDTDVQAKILMRESSVIISKLKSLIGDEAYVEGEINRAKISSFIFSSQENLNKVNSIVHPEVCSHFMSWKSEQISDVVFVESAILYESGLSDMVDEVWCVVADEEKRVERVMKRNGLTKQEVLDRINSQISDKERGKRADHIIDNSGNISLLKQIIKIL
ncbi:MAG: dephospho-CoA kinase [Muribaculaceae bacterium]|nr:dephospho-CoA kinase [Muribaculaceae bacterium]